MPFRELVAACRNDKFAGRFCFHRLDGRRRRPADKPSRRWRLRQWFRRDRRHRWHWRIGRQRRFWRRGGHRWHRGQWWIRRVRPVWIRRQWRRRRIRRCGRGRRRRWIWRRGRGWWSRRCWRSRRCRRGRWRWRQWGFGDLGFKRQSLYRSGGLCQVRTPLSSANQTWGPRR